MNSKKYLSVILLSLACFVIYHAIVWNTFTIKLFNSNLIIGDLGRISYLTESFFPKKSAQNLAKKHLKYNDKLQIDILTIGDSFSNGGGGGVNNYYQDFISTNQNLRVMNMEPLNKGFIETLLILNNNGILDTLSPSVIILESVERYSISRFAKNINWDININNKKLNDEILNLQSSKKPDPLFINHLNYNALLYNVLFYFDDNAFFSKVYRSKLTNDFFSSNNKSDLLFYYEDLKNIERTNVNTIYLLNNNLNKLQNILKEKKIKLYFMPVVDKYNLYSKYIIKNKYKESNFFELIRELPKDYILIDTKKILRQLTDKNEKDVYYSDDTHWTSKSSSEIFNTIKF